MVNAFMKINFSEKSCQRPASHLTLNVWLGWHCLGNGLREFKINIIWGWFHCRSYVHLSHICCVCGFKSVPWLQGSMAVRSHVTSYLLLAQPGGKWRVTLSAPLTQISGQICQNWVGVEEKQIAMAGNALTLLAPFLLSPVACNKCLQ